MKYFVISEEYDDTNAYTESVPDTFDRMYELVEGVSCRDDWPPEAVFEFSNDRPEGINLRDYVENSFGLLIVSDQFRELIELTGAPNLEFLPIQMSDHKGRQVADNYWIANFLTLVEVIDRDKSEFEIDAADDTMISKFDKLVLLQEVKESGPPILRMREDYMLILVREDLVDHINKNTLGGMKFLDAESYVSYPV